ncbi:unnamed protein product, partial [Ectocarpus fasciculatus]
MSPVGIESGIGGNSGGDGAAAGSRPPMTMTPRGSASGGSGDAGPPPKTPSHPRGGGGANSDHRLTPPGTAEATRKAKKLVAMAAAAEAFAETAAVNVSGADGGGGGGDQQPGTEDLLALANAAAVGGNPPTRAPGRGRKLMRYLSNDGGPADDTSSTANNGMPKARGLMRMNSRGPGIQPPGSVPRMGRKRMAFRRLNSLSSGAWGARAESVSDSGSRSPPPPPPPPPVGHGVPALDAASGGPAASRNAPTNINPAAPTTTTTDPAFAATAAT